MNDRPLLTSLSNPLVKQARALRQRKARGTSGLFLVEGLHHVGSAVEAGWGIERLIFAPDLLTGDFAQALLDEARRSGLTIQPVSAKVMDSLTEKENPQGILATVKQRSLQLSDLDSVGSAVALVSPQDPGNVGTILRTIDAAGADALFTLDGGVDLYHPTCVRASMGTLFWKPVVQTSFVEFVAWAKKKELQLVGTSAHAQRDYHEIGLGNSPWVLVLGSEQKGLSEEQIAACDLTISMPMRGRVSSLNLAVAAGILLYALKA
ncbi:MAG: RNA methyltransferase [Anaerolineales bacterium]|jgi:TrmH family RNA methyltransferase